MRRALAALLATAAIGASAAAPAEAAPGVTAAVAVVVVDGVVNATCDAVAHDPSAEWTRVTCWTPHRTSDLSLPGPVATTTLRATEPLPVEVCVSAEAGYADGRRVSDGPYCRDHVGLLFWDYCRAFADPPTAQHAFNAMASGGFVCDVPRPDLSVEVCLEVLAGNVWEPISCSSNNAGTETYVTAEAWGCWYGLYMIRSVAMGSASTGETDRAESEPVSYLCIPLCVRGMDRSAVESREGEIPRRPACPDPPRVPTSPASSAGRPSGPPPPI